MFSKGYEGVEYYNNFVPDIIFRYTKKHILVKFLEG
jgi:hypothetical protein